MNIKLTYVGLALYSIGYAMLFGTWVFITFRPDLVKDAGSLVSYIQVTLGALTGHILTLINPTKSDAPPSSQGGFGRPVFLALLAALSLVGCASFQQALTGYQSAAATSLDAANDNMVRVWSYQACATPFSTAIRNPQIIPALRALCLPAGAASTPTGLLDSVTTK